MGKFGSIGKWEELQTQLPEYLEKHGLDNFRNHTNNALRGYGTIDIDPIDSLNSEKKLRLLEKFLVLTKDKAIFRKLYKRLSWLYLNITLEQKLESMYLFAKYYGMANKAKPIESISDSLIGNPKNVLKKDDKFYTYPLLRSYVQYAQTCNVIDYEKISSILEIGGGFGMQAEVFKKLYPHLEITLVDLPANAYLQKEYLKKQSLDDVKVILPDKLEGSQFDMLWNSISFQVMPKKTVFDYFKIINKNAKKFVCLHNKIENKNSVNNSVTKEEYIENLPDFDLIYNDISQGQFLGTHQNIFNLIFQRK